MKNYTFTYNRGPNWNRVHVDNLVMDNPEEAEGFAIGLKAGGAKNVKYEAGEEIPTMNQDEFDTALNAMQNEVTQTMIDLREGAKSLVAEIEEAMENESWIRTDSALRNLGSIQHKLMAYSRALWSRDLLTRKESRR